MKKKKSFFFFIQTHAVVEWNENKIQLDNIKQHDWRYDH